MTSLNLEKGQRVDITKGTGITKVLLALGWNEGKFDVDASLLMLSNDKLTNTDDDVVYFNHLKHSSGAVSHSGDNLTGAGTANTDKEVITIDLSKLPSKYDKLVTVINIYKAEERKQNFGMVEGAFGRIIDGATGQELAKYNLSEDYSTFTGVYVGEIYKHDGEWKFKALGEGFKGDLNTAVKKYS